MRQYSSRRIKSYSAKLTLQDEMMNCYALQDPGMEESVFHIPSLV